MAQSRDLLVAARHGPPTHSAGDRELISEFFRRVPEGDRTFFNEDVLDPDVVGASSDRERASCG